MVDKKQRTLLFLVSLLVAAKDGPAASVLLTDPTALITADDYPVAALRAGASGKVQVMLEVDAQGRVSSCKITGTSNVTVLDMTTCDLMQSRAKFRPAIGSDGQAIASHFTRSIVWRLPEAADSMQPDQPDGPKPVPITDPATWFTPDDYPPAAMEAGEQGAVLLLLQVSATGAIVGCSVDGEDTYQSLAIGTCTVAKARGAFHPARDASGKPVASTYRRRVFWTTQGTALDLSVGRHLISESVRKYRVDASGKILDCTVEKPSELSGPCYLAASSTLGEPLAKNDKPTAGTITRSVTTWIDPD